MEHKVNIVAFVYGNCAVTTDVKRYIDIWIETNRLLKNSTNEVGKMSHL
jgi:hypothetical protein